MRAIQTTMNGSLRGLQGGLRALSVARDTFIVLGATAAALWAANRIVHAIMANAPGGVVV